MIGLNNLNISSGAPTVAVAGDISLGDESDGNNPDLARYSKCPSAHDIARFILNAYFPHHVNQPPDQ